MKTTHILAHAGLCAVLGVPPLAAFAQQAGHASHAGHAVAPASAATAAAADMADGEVRRVDKAAGKITLRHGEIKNLDMPPMTMVFQVGEAALLDKVRAGDKVRFRAVQADGGYRVIALEPVR